MGQEIKRYTPASNVINLYRYDLQPGIYFVKYIIGETILAFDKLIAM